MPQHDCPAPLKNRWEKIEGDFRRTAKGMSCRMRFSDVREELLYQVEPIGFGSFLRNLTCVFVGYVS